MDIINKFLEQQNYLANPNVVEIILYGSAAYQTTYGDIDLFILLEKGSDMKGKTLIDDVSIDYSERTVSSLLLEIEKMGTSLNTYLLGIFFGGKVLYQKGDAVDYIETELEKYSGKHKVRKISNERMDRIAYLKAQFENTRGQYQQFIYYNLLDEIRKYYHESNGYSKISSHKIYSLYLDREKARKQYFLNLPPVFFIETYTTLLKGYSEEDFQRLQNIAKTKELEQETFILSQTFVSKQEILYKSVVVSNIVEKCISCYEMGKPDFLSVYFLCVEKIRSLYAMMHNIESYPCDIYALDETFLKRLQSLIEYMDVHALANLFLEITQSLQIDYKNYKIKCY